MQIMKKIFTRDREFYRSLVTLSIPIMLQNLITYSVGLADNLMIGSLGDSAVSGVYMGNQIQTVLQVLSAGIEAAILLLSSQYWGKRETGPIRRVVSIGLDISMTIGLVVSVVCALIPRQVLGIFTDETAVIDCGEEYLSILCYSYLFFTITQALIAAMRSVETARIGMYVSLTSLVIDVSLNYVLIFGKLGFEPMGIRGAAIATLIARICEAVIMVVYVRFADRKLCYRFSGLLHPDRRLAKDFIRCGLPLIGGQLVWGCNLIGNSIILGHYPESVITAVSLANTINNLMYVSINGMAAAVGIFIGKKVGAGEIGEIRQYANTVQIVFLGIGVLMHFMFRFAGAPFISLYTISDEAAGFAAQFITVLSYTSIGTCYQCSCLFGLVKSGGDVSFVFKNDTCFVFGVVLPSAIVTSLLGCEPWVVYLCLKSDQILKCITAFFKIRRYNWMKNLTRPAAPVPAGADSTK